MFVGAANVYVKPFEVRESLRRQRFRFLKHFLSIQFALLKVYLKKIQYMSSEGGGNALSA